MHVVFCAWLLWCSVSAGYFLYTAWGCPGDAHLGVAQCTALVHGGGACVHHPAVAPPLLYPVMRHPPAQLAATVALRPAHSRGWCSFPQGGMPQGPLFMLSDGSPLHRSLFVQEVQQALSASGFIGLNFNSHSFCIEAATSAGAAGVPESTIKVLGHWKSMAYQQYIRPFMDDLAVVLGPVCLLAYQCVPQA